MQARKRNVGSRVVVFLAITLQHSIGAAFFFGVNNVAFCLVLLVYDAARLVDCGQQKRRPRLQNKGIQAGGRYLTLNVDQATACHLHAT